MLVRELSKKRKIPDRFTLDQFRLKRGWDPVLGENQKEDETTGKKLLEITKKREEG